MHATIALNRVRDVHSSFAAYTGPDDSAEARRLNNRLNAVHQTFGRSQIKGLPDLLAKLEYIAFLDPFCDGDAAKAHADAVKYVRGMVDSQRA